MMWMQGYLSWYIVPILIVSGVLLIRTFLWQWRTARMLEMKELRSFSLWRKAAQALLLFVGLMSLGFALLRPQSEAVEQTIMQEGRDVLIALDISRSMLAQDMKPSRLAFAKEKIKALIASLKAERVSLLIFSGIPFVYCPFTSDTQAFLGLLDAMDVETISSGTTAFDKAILKALDTFAAVPSRAHKIMVLFTDGEDVAGHLGEVEDRACQQGLSIYTVGIGTTQGAPIPLYDEQGMQQGHQKDENEAVVISRLNEELLKKLAQKTGAQYCKTDIELLVQAIQHYEKEQLGSASYAVKQEQFNWFAALSALCLLLEVIL